MGYIFIKGTIFDNGIFLQMQPPTDDEFFI